MNILDSISNPQGLFFLLSALFVLGYGGYQLRDIFAGPRLQVISPVNGTLVTSDQIVLRGTSSDIASLSVNGHKIFTDLKGEFRENLLLLDGYNVIEVRATDKLARSTVKRIELMLASNELQAAGVSENGLVP